MMLVLLMVVVIVVKMIKTRSLKFVDGSSASYITIDRLLR